VSVINKMLRDLDQRQTAQVQLDNKSGAPVLRQGTASVGETAVPRPTARRGFNQSVAVLIQLALLAVAIGGAFWWWQKSPADAGAPLASQPSTQTAPVPAAATDTATGSTVSTAAATPATKADSVSVEPPDRIASKANTSAKSPSVKTVDRSIPPPDRPANGAGSEGANLKLSLAVSQTVSPKTVAALQPAAVSSAGAGSGASAGVSADGQTAQVRQLQAGRETLAQAQGLWNAGSHDAAIELLQQALAIAERSALSSSTAANTQLLATLAREQGRMQLAQGRPQAALDGLTRLEPLLGRDADAWALRGNVAQRLGRHQDSVHAYTTALQIRPNEQRWLLGAAVSLAALGQTGGASEMAAKARALGPISAEVQNYLRQAGVPLNEP
jgi:Tfp pilus assembly protein PilF